MGERGPSVRDELNHALVEKAKELLMGKLDDETVRRFIIEEAAKELHGILESWDLRQAIRAVVAEKIKGVIPQVADELLAREDFRALLIGAVEGAAKDGIKEGAAGLKAKLSGAIGGEKRY